MNRKERKEHKEKDLQMGSVSTVKGRGQIMTPSFLCELCVLCG
jgi:hypothetical protein